MNDKPVIIIPSYKRSHFKIFDKLKYISLKKIVFVRKEEYFKYLKNIHSSFEVVAIKSEVKCIGETKKEIIQYCSINNIKWVFMLDDDVIHIRKVSKNKEDYFNIKAFKYWFKIANEYNLVISGPCQRAFIRFYEKNSLYVNKYHCIQCVLLYIPTIIQIGNYGKLEDVGAEDMTILYYTMINNHKVGMISNIEYDVPAIGKGEGGNNATEERNLIARYDKYVNTFLNNVKPDKNLIKIKTTKTGLKSISLVFEKFNSKIIDISKLGD